MKKVIFLLSCCLIAVAVSSQTVASKLKIAYKKFENDPQLNHAISSIYVIDAKTGKVIFERNASLGLAGASTQKIFTAATAFELLGNEYRFKTRLGYSGKINGGVLNGDLYVVGSGDPTLGSWRWQQTKDSIVLDQWIGEIKKMGIQKINGTIRTNTSAFSYQAIPDGWIWQDIGNYYGAGSYPLNWKENQYDLYLRSGSKLNDTVAILNDSSFHFNVNELRSAPKGTGDNAYIYYDHSISGTIPVNERSFGISGATDDPVRDLLSDLGSALSKNAIHLSGENHTYHRYLFLNDSSELKDIHFFYTQYSPALDSIVYWFLQKSINLYGESLVKTFSYEKNSSGTTGAGVDMMIDFWRQRGIEKDEMHIVDGSGLSPLNRITTHAQVKVLQFAKSRSWYPRFYDGLPEYNGMKMKSGTINGVKGFSGYHKSKKGEEFIFSFLVNNYNGSPSALVNKMFGVLNSLK
ncbi:MAG: D-alanyl-D-alanine carboxypeptidase/D-alanyl-D-alanine-endopeptidase [Chitinophagaceae bacterium]|jgi:D-alanyl-D-alanine carboxypeptidase/D-alanyl-D-alanine-endopeptidase (penicillin-binding protein 4)|nr:D-alanyl-D-alanine carboxypeptidase/D-alanyl-D-alanine-endopeptidase [Chitinophagaceae bacterium]OQY94332.1 MAG: D-alanyl-D-alanine carboxypeptidase/D-alanyl-D-alanine-endopeptidase [Sphingobacteriales bacterium UTBCD1]